MDEVRGIILILVMDGGPNCCRFMLSYNSTYPKYVEIVLLFAVALTRTPHFSKILDSFGAGM